MPRPSMMPPEATTGTSGPTASTTCGTSAIVPTSAGARAAAPPTPNVPRWPPASPPCAITASAPPATARRASSTVVTIGSRRAPGGARRLGHGRRVVERRDHRWRRAASAASTSATGESAWRRLRRLVGQAQLAPERQQDLEDARALAGRGRRRRELRIDAERGRRARARAHAPGRARGRRTVMPDAPRTPRPPARVTAAASSGVLGPLAMPASRIGTRMPSRSHSGVRRPAAHSSLDPAQRLMPLSVA